MQDQAALYGAQLMQPGLTGIDSEENTLRVCLDGDCGGDQRPV